MSQPAGAKKHEPKETRTGAGSKITIQRQEACQQRATEQYTILSEPGSYREKRASSRRDEEQDKQQADAGDYTGKWAGGARERAMAWVGCVMRGCGKPKTEAGVGRGGSGSEGKEVLGWVAGVDGCLLPATTCCAPPMAGGSCGRGMRGCFSWYHGKYTSAVLRRQSNNNTVAQWVRTTGRVRGGYLLCAALSSWVCRGGAESFYRAGLQDGGVCDWLRLATLVRRRLHVSRP
ncbi:hypothetical protein BCR34DRAFT_157413 [Clohesyomyces aquaticus]|uniref:Uncharacterized protein n=1 Tax=Clohesyomyces aquaticus TaxID=1231657 RepID=A0A1Y1YJ92_9PLEO|nr:hypothetical protein BCR34DRAFT_157413 [Clohesyomyces aquaticus]